MTRLISAVARLLRERDAETAPHFHQSANDALPAVCFDTDCRYPRLDA